MVLKPPIKQVWNLKGEYAVAVILLSPMEDEFLYLCNFSLLCQLSSFVHVFYLSCVDLNHAAFKFLRGKHATTKEKFVQIALNDHVKYGGTITHLLCMTVKMPATLIVLLSSQRETWFPPFKFLGSCSLSRCVSRQCNMKTHSRLKRGQYFQMNCWCNVIMKISW